MPRAPRRRAATPHPDVSELDLFEVLHALSDPTRMTIVQTLLSEPEMRCGEFPVDVAPSTLTHHFRVLREAGVIRQRAEGNRRWTSLRTGDLEDRFPGVLGAIVSTLAPPPAPALTA